MAREQPHHTIAGYLAEIMHFARWACTRHVPLAMVDEVSVAIFLDDHLPSRGCTGSVRHDRADHSAAFGHVRGLAPRTRSSALRIVGRLLSKRFDDAAIDIAAIEPEPNHSHSIINERSKLLIRKAIASASQTFTVIFAVNLSGTSIGAGLRAIRQNLTFRDLSTSIDSRDDRQRHRHASVSAGEASKKHRHRTS